MTGSEHTPGVLTIEGTSEKPVFKLNGVVLPVVAMKELIQPRVPTQNLYDVGSRYGPVMQIVGQQQPGFVTLTLMFNELYLVTGDPEPPKPGTYAREGLDL